jgi:tRNA (guanine-N7-)-methyltransferase
MLYDPTEHRIRSFVTRAGRLSVAQARALEELGPKFMIEYAKAPLDFEQAFGRKAPVILEIGFGMGDTTSHIARAMPEKDFIGVEVHTPGVGSLLKQIGEQGLTNLRLIQGPLVKLLAEKLAPGGYLHCATDWEDYAVQMLEVLGAEPLLQNTAEGYAPQPAYRPLTKFENRGLKLGHGVWDLVFTKK